MKIRGNPYLRFADRRAGPILLRMVARRRPKQEKIGHEKGPDRVVILKLGTIGDSLLTLPAIRALRSWCTGAEMTLVHSPANADVATRIEGVSRRIVFDPGRWTRNPGHALRFIHHLRAIDADWAIDFEPWSRVSALVALLSGARLVAGYRTAGQNRHHGFDVCIEHRSDVHEAVNNGRLVEALGAKVQDYSIPFPLDAKEESAWTRFLESAGGPPRYAVIHPWSAGYKGHLKEWDEDKCANLARRFIASGIRVVLTGGPLDRPRSEKLARKIGEGCVSAAGTATLGETAGLLKLACLVVTVNTGILHLAAAVGAEILVLDGPAGTERWGPLTSHATVVRSGAYCSPCLDLGFEYACRTGWCMSDLGVEAVWTATTEVLARTAA